LPVRSPLPKDSLQRDRLRQQGQLGTCHASAAIVVRMDADAHRLATGKVAAEIFNLIGVNVRVFTSTVAGRLMIMGRSAQGSHTSATASQISSANSGSVKQKVSGEYSYCHRVWVLFAELTNEPCRTYGKGDHVALSMPNTT
jgi:hypothetical protein